MDMRELYLLVGGDYEDLVKRLPREDKLPGYLLKYAATEDMSLMVAAYEKGDYKTVFEKSHSLKGMAANLSLKEHAAVISEICEAVRNGEPQSDIKALIETAASNHNKLIKLARELS